MRLRTDKFFETNKMNMHFEFSRSMVKLDKKTEPGRILPARLKLLYEVLKALKDDGSRVVISSRWSFSYLCCHSSQLSCGFCQHLIGLCLQKTKANTG
jgi:hypothetical protein